MADQLRVLSMRLEKKTGADSIPTVERVYPNENGIYECVWPYCGYRRHDAAAMWKHVHFSKKHPAATDVLQAAKKLGITR